MSWKACWQDCWIYKAWKLIRRLNALDWLIIIFLVFAFRVFTPIVKNLKSLEYRKEEIIKEDSLCIKNRENYDKLQKKVDELIKKHKRLRRYFDAD